MRPAMPFPKFLVALLCCLALAAAGFAQGRHTKGEKPLSIAQGRKVELADFLVTDRTTIFMFTSEYHPACRSYSEPLLALHQRGSNLAVVKVDINRAEYHEIDWESPVARQYTLSGKGLPHFKIYGPDGKLMVEGPEARQQVNDWLAEMK
jgi:thiol-disulfide isomerase/thioredoxin